MFAKRKKIIGMSLVMEKGSAIYIDGKPVLDNLSFEEACRGLEEGIDIHMGFETTATKDHHYICEIGRLFWGDDKQCYAADAVYRKVKSFLKQTESNTKEG